MALLVSRPPCVAHEDDHILVAHKPAGLNTHAPSPFAGEGIYEWLRHREPRWASLATIHRLDKTTSGLMVFSKTKLANRSLTDQFAKHQVRKRYLFLAANRPEESTVTVRAGLSRVGDKYVVSPKGEFAETRFGYVEPAGQFHLLWAEPLTGRTHQIRVHAQAQGFPILGDTTYGGTPFQRLCLHAAELVFRHPQTGLKAAFRAEPDFQGDAASALRRLMIEPELTTAFRLRHGAADGEAGGLCMERWGPHGLVLSDALLSAAGIAKLRAQAEFEGLKSGVYHKQLSKQAGRFGNTESSPKLLSGEAAAGPFTVRENGVAYEISFQQGYSVGLFLDQRENRWRLLRNHIAAEFPVFAGGLGGQDVLNTFAYTCGFSVCAALAGARTTSLDLSKKYLEWGQRNFALNRIDAAGHDFIYGDVFDWCGRFAKKGRQFGLILLDPPTFSRAQDGRTFQAEKDFGKLAAAVLPLLRKDGVLFASTNAQKLKPEAFLGQINDAIRATGRRAEKQHYVPQPVDFPISKEEPAYLKTVWMRIT